MENFQIGDCVWWQGVNKKHYGLIEVDDQGEKFIQCEDGVHTMSLKEMLPNLHLVKSNPFK